MSPFNSWIVIFLFICTIIWPGLAQSKVDAKSETRCASFRDKLGVLVSRVTGCFVNNSQPFSLCRHCTDVYLDFRDLHRQMKSKDNVTLDTGGNCLDKLSTSDRVHVLPVMLGSIEDSWKLAQCPLCYTELDWRWPNGSLAYRDNNSSLKFFSLHQSLMQCLIKFTNDSDFNHLNRVDFPAGLVILNSSLACKDCDKLYQEITKFYDNVIHGKGKKVCMDIQDAMNFTQRLWFYDFKCGLDQIEPLLQLLPLSSIIIIGTLFYIFASRIFYHPIRRLIYRPNRVGVHPNVTIIPENHDEDEIVHSRSSTTLNRQKLAES